LPTTWPDLFSCAETCTASWTRQSAAATTSAAVAATTDSTSCRLHNCAPPTSGRRLVPAPVSPGELKNTVCPDTVAAQLELSGPSRHAGHGHPRRRPWPRTALHRSLLISLLAARSSNLVLRDGSAAAADGPLLPRCAGAATAIAARPVGLGAADRAPSRQPRGSAREETSALLGGIRRGGGGQRCGEQRRTRFSVAARPNLPFLASTRRTPAAREDVVHLRLERTPVTTARCEREGVGHTPRVLMQGRKNSRRRTPGRIPLYSY
jgi:hypothetical protein